MERSVAVFSDETPVNTFSGAPLDRRNNDRRDAQFIAHCLASEEAKFLLFTWDLRVAAVESPPSIRLCLLPRRVALKILDAVSSNALNTLRNLSGPNGVADDDSDLMFLGEYTNPKKGCWCFAVKLPEMSGEELEEKVVRRINATNDAVEKGTPKSKFLDVRMAGAVMSSKDSAIAAHGRSLFEFHKRHRFCGLCGSRTIAKEGGSRRRCIRNTENGAAGTGNENESSICTGVWFPRSDPVAIVLVVDPQKNQCLLGRQIRFPPNMYSCLAGFAEEAESIEDVVRREIYEESGIRIGRCRYHSSQPWPFPYSLMIGCIAEAVSREIKIDPHEIEEARWFTREQLKEMIAASHRVAALGRDAFKQDPASAPLSCPPSIAIAHQLIRSYADDHPITRFAPASSTISKPVEPKL